MNLIKTILLSAAVYMFAKKDGESKVQDLEKKMEEILDQTEKAIREANEERDKAEQFTRGDLADRISCYLYLTASRVNNSGNTWNTKYILEVKNNGTLPFRFSAVRVFWSVKGYTSKLIPWQQGSYTVQPGKSVEVTLKGFYLKKAFNSVPDIQRIESYFKTRNGQRFNEELELECDAEFIVTSQAVAETKAIKGFKGRLTGYHYGYIYHPYTTINGDELTKFDNPAETTTTTE